MPTVKLERPKTFSGLSRTNPNQVTGGGAGNWGGAQPNRVAVARAPRNLGTMFEDDLNRAEDGTTYTNRTGVRLDQRPSVTGQRPDSGYTEYTPRPLRIPTAGLAATPATPVASPTTVRAQQTETANPLSGDTNAAAGGTTQAVNPGMDLGFSRRGIGAAPAGQDSMPTSNIGASMQSTFNNLRGKVGLSRRQFQNRGSSSPYSSAVRSLFSGAAMV